MSWDDLPTDLHIKILAMHFEIRNEACKKIQKNWGKYFAPIIGAIDVALELEVGEDGFFLVMWPSTARIMEHCANKISGKNHHGFWKFITQQIKLGLYNELYTGGPDAPYYNRTELACDKLIQKLNIIY